jgi:hypothetical protein
MVLWTEACRAAIDERLHLAKVEVIRKRMDVSQVFNFVTLIGEQQSELFNQQSHYSIHSRASYSINSQ